MKGENMPEGAFAMRDILLKMIHTGKYSPGSDWLTPSYGKGLCVDKAFCAFKMCTRPALTNKHDIDLVFFDDGRRLTPQTFCIGPQPRCGPGPSGRAPGLLPRVRGRVIPINTDHSFRSPGV